MTGFGRNEGIVDGRHIIVEIKSVNHKFFEYSIKISRGFSFLEDKLKSVVADRVSRGKVDMYVHIENLEDTEAKVLVNHSLLKGYIDAYEEIREKYDIKNEISMELITKNSDIFTVQREAEDEDKVFESVKEIMLPALESFIKMREAEGEKLALDIKERANTILNITNEVEERSPKTVSEYRTRLENKLKEILEDRNIDEQRVMLEAAIFADKVAVAEETVRLKSHVEQLMKFISSKNAIGRKMDFLVQEMNREANTIGSKASDSTIAYMVVDLKSEIEKIREQIQNIE